MGRVKLKLKTVESETGRIVTYSKRKNSILKKTNELAVLCEIDVVLIMFSPTGRVALQMGNAVKFDQIIRRFANTSAEERERSSNLKVYETLKKSYKNSDHEVHSNFFSGTRSQSVEDLSAQSNLLQTQLVKTQQRLSDWRNPEKIESVELLGQMEDYLNGLFDQVESQRNQISLPLNAGAERLSPEHKCKNKSPMSDQKFDVKSADADLRFPGDGRPSIAPTLIPNFLLESSFRTDAHMRFVGNNIQTIASTPNSNFISKSPHGELQLLGIESQSIASTLRPNFLLQREPHMSTSLTAAYLSGRENAVTDSTGDYANNILQTELLRNELVTLKQEARRNEFARSDFLINAYNGTNDFAKEGTLGNRFSEAEGSNELFKVDNSGIRIQQHYPCPQQRIISLIQQNIAPFQSHILCAQEKNVPKQQQNPYKQQDIVTLEQQNLDCSFDERNTGLSSSNHDPVLEWSGSFGDLDFSLSDSQRPLSVDDYETEVLAQPTDQPKLPDVMAISENDKGCIDI